MNILAATAPDTAKNEIYNVALGDRTSLKQLFDLILKELNLNGIDINTYPLFRDFRIGDVRHSQADISKAIRILGYDPEFQIAEGIHNAMPWYINSLRKA